MKTASEFVKFCNDFSSRTSDPRNQRPITPESSAFVAEYMSRTTTVAEELRREGVDCNLLFRDPKVAASVILGPGSSAAFRSLEEWFGPALERVYVADASQ